MLSFAFPAGLVPVVNAAVDELSRLDSEEIADLSFFGMCVWVICAIFVLSYLVPRHRELIVRVCRSVFGLVGLPTQRVVRFVKELQRKGFHFNGLLIPGIYYVGLRTNVLTPTSATAVLGVLASIYLAFDLARIRVPVINSWYREQFKHIMRENEAENLTAVCWYMIGGFVAMALFHPLIAITSVVNLVFGDFFAALIGVAFGKVELFNKRSLEGSLACAASCMLASMFLLVPRLPLDSALIMALAGSVAATLSELFSTRIDDNLTMPFASGIAMTIAARVMQTPLLASVPLPHL